MKNHEVLAFWLWNEYQHNLEDGNMPDAVYWFGLYQDAIVAEGGYNAR